MTILQEFITQNQGKLLADQFGLYKGQCVSLAKQWIRKNKWPMLWGNAIDWQYRGDGKNYKFFKNTASFIPKAGDFAIFSVGKYGHIGVVVSATVKTMKVFNQNWPHGTATDPATTTSFDYVKPKCVGFLRKM